MRGLRLAAVLLTALLAPGIEAAHANDDVVHTHYDGVTNDLLTAGLGKTGLGSPIPPGFADALNPTAEELRRSAIYNNYRALIDPTPGGGYGTLYGPNVTADGVVTAGEGRIAGDEYIAYEKADGRRNVTMMVQIPDTFDPGNACIVTAPSSGSRGVYGAIATAGEWGLKRGCAVAYTDKGTGTGAHNLQANTVNLMRGERADAAAARDDSNFTAALSARERAAFNAATPNRFAFKHAHSQQNPEKHWGDNVLRSIRFTFDMLERKFRPQRLKFGKRNTIVIASSVSNGGGASVLAVEQDEDGLIDGLAVGEPNVNPRFKGGFSIVQGGGPALFAHSKPLIDYTTLVNVFQSCASLAPANATAALNLAPSPARCADLKAKGLLTATTLPEQATQAQKIINDYGILPEQNLVQPGYSFASVAQSIAVTYANTYGRFSVLDNLCGFSFAANAGLPGGPPVALAAANEAQIFATSNGIPPTSGLALINNAAPGGPKEERGSTPNQNLDGALCLRSLATAGMRSPERGSPAGSAPGKPHRRRRRGYPRLRQAAARSGGVRHRPQRRHPAAELHLARLFRAQQHGRRLNERAALLRGDERAASGHVQPVSRLQRQVRSAAPLLQSGDGPDVRAPAAGRAAAAEPGGAHDPARPRGAADHGRERAADRRLAAGGRADHLQRRPGPHPGVNGRCVGPWQGE